MVKNNSGGNKSKNIGSKFTKKNINVPEPDFENSFFAEVNTKPNGLMCKVKILTVPEKFKDKINYQVEELMKEGIQVNIGQLKNDKRNNLLCVGDIVQVEFNFEMKRQNGDQYGYILCKYSTNDVRVFKRNGMILAEKEKDVDDMFEGLDKNESQDEKENENEIDLNDL
jgi:hypothetical protein